MAKKNQEPVEPESESETDASSEKPETTPNNPVVTNSTPPLNSSESDSEPETTTNNTITKDESESDSDAKKPKPSKRPAPAESPKSPDAKKPKTEHEKKVLFQRLWTDEDEIVILNGMIEFEANNNVSPTSDMDAFLDYIKKDLHVDNFTKRQLQGKVRKLKKRYQNNKGKDKTSMKPHDKVALELSEKLWGGASGTANGSVVRKKEKAAVSASDKKKYVAVDGALTKKALVRFGSSTEENLLRIGAELFGGEENIAGLEEWKKLDREELELSLKTLDVKRAKIKLVLNIME